MEQAGVYRIDLYERKNLNISYDSGGDIENIFTDGEILAIENRQIPVFSYRPEKTNNGEVGKIYTIRWFMYDISSTSLQEIANLKQSPYGWSPEIYFYNGQRKFIDAPFIFSGSTTPDNSNSFKINIANKAPYTDNMQAVTPIEGEGIGYWFVEADFVVQ